MLIVLANLSLKILHWQKKTNFWSQEKSFHNPTKTCVFYYCTSFIRCSPRLFVHPKYTCLTFSRFFMHILNLRGCVWHKKKSVNTFASFCRKLKKKQVKDEEARWCCFFYEHLDALNNQTCTLFHFCIAIFYSKEKLLNLIALHVLIFMQNYLECKNKRTRNKSKLT